jgi:hypothetical protein
VGDGTIGPFLGRRRPLWSCTAQVSLMPVDVKTDRAGVMPGILQSGYGQGRHGADLVHVPHLPPMPSRRRRALSHLARVATTMKRYHAGGKGMSDQGTTRREVIKKAVYATPILITLQANLELASTGSGLQAPSDYVLTGGSGQTHPVAPTPLGSRTVPPDNAAPGGATPPPRHAPPPAGSDSAPSDNPAPVSSEPPPTGNAGPDDTMSPPQDDSAADDSGKPRQRRQRRRRHLL